MPGNLESGASPEVMPACPGPPPPGLKTELGINPMQPGLFLLNNRAGQLPGQPLAAPGLDMVPSGLSQASNASGSGLNLSSADLPSATLAAPDTIRTDGELIEPASALFDDGFDFDSAFAAYDAETLSREAEPKTRQNKQCPVLSNAALVVMQQKHQLRDDQELAKSTGPMPKVIEQMAKPSLRVWGGGDRDQNSASVKLSPKLDKTIGGISLEKAPVFLLVPPENNKQVRTGEPVFQNFPVGDKPDLISWPQDRSKSSLPSNLLLPKASQNPVVAKTTDTKDSGYEPKTGMFARPERRSLAVQDRDKRPEDKSFNPLVIVRPGKDEIPRRLVETAAVNRPDDRLTLTSSEPFPSRREIVVGKRLQRVLEEAEEAGLLSAPRREPSPIQVLLRSKEKTNVSDKKYAKKTATPSLGKVTKDAALIREQRRAGEVLRPAVSKNQAGVGRAERMKQPAVHSSHKKSEAESHRSLAPARAPDADETRSAVVKPAAGKKNRPAVQVHFSNRPVLQSAGHEAAVSLAPTQTGELENLRTGHLKIVSENLTRQDFSRGGESFGGKKKLESAVNFVGSPEEESVLEPIAQTASLETGSGLEAVSMTSELTELAGWVNPYSPSEGNLNVLWEEPGKPLVTKESKQARQRSVTAGETGEELGTNERRYPLPVSGVVIQPSFQVWPQALPATDTRGRAQEQLPVSASLSLALGGQNEHLFPADDLNQARDFVRTHLSHLKHASRAA